MRCKSLVQRILKEMIRDKRTLLLMMGCPIVYSNADACRF